MDAGAEAAGLAIRDAACLPGRSSLPSSDGDTMVESGDLVSALVQPDEVGALREKMQGGTGLTTDETRYRGCRKVRIYALDAHPI